MSSKLVILGRLADRNTEDALIRVCDQLGLVTSLHDVYQSVRSLIDAVCEPGDLILQVDAPESGTSTELDDEVVELGEGSRLVRLLRFLVQLNLRDVRLIWSWDFPDIASLRHSEGNIDDLIHLLRRPESWGVAEMSSPKLCYISYDSPLLFALRPDPA